MIRCKSCEVLLEADEECLCSKCLQLLERDLAAEKALLQTEIYLSGQFDAFSEEV